MSGTQPGYYPGGSNPAAPVSIVAPADGITPLTLAGTILQTANLTEVYRGPTLVYRIDPFGNTRIGQGAPGGTLGINTNNNVNQVGIQVMGAAAQIANLQEWKNSSGTVLAKLTPAGVMDSLAYTLAGTTITATENGGNFLRMLQASAQAASLVSSVKLYVRAGSASGCKLVAIGPNNVETTILDNL